MIYIRLIFLFSIILNFTSSKSFAQAPDWEWAKSAGGKSSDAGTGVITDSRGNLYVIGSFASPTITFGLTTLEHKDPKENRKDNDIFIVKYDTQGNVIWAKSEGGISGDVPYGIALDSSGNLYVTGFFLSPTITFGTTTLTKAGNYNNMFLVKFDPNGSVLWATSVASSSTGGIQLATSLNGDVSLLGVLGNMPVTLGATTLTPVGSSDIFIVRYDSTGSVIWAKSAGGLHPEQGKDISTDEYGNIYVTGHFKGDSIKLDTIALYNTGDDKYFSDNAFIAKYDIHGNVVWVRSVEGTASDFGMGIVTDSKGYSCMIGYSASDSIRIDNTTVFFGNNNLGNLNFYIAKFDPNGGLHWASSATNGQTYAYKVTMDSEGNIYATGIFTGSISFGTMTATTKGSADIFVVKFSPQGEVLWLKSVDGIYQTDYAEDIASDHKGNLYITGGFQSPAILFGTTDFINKGQNDMFVAKLRNTTTDITEDKKDTKESFTLSPNPTASQFHITNLEPGNWTITIYTLDGQSVFKKEISEADAMIDLSGKAKGAYVYRLLRDGAVFKSGKLVLE